MERKEQIADWSNKLLDFLLNYRQNNPTFKFWVRQRNTKNRLDDGYWFQGDDGYIFLAFYNRSGGTNMTRSMGFVTNFIASGPFRSYIEIVYKDEEDQRLIPFYEECLLQLGPAVQVGTLKFTIEYPEKDVLKNLQHFLDVQKPLIDSLIDKYGVRDLMEIPDSTFNSTVAKIQKRRGIIEDSNLVKTDKPMTLNLSINLIYYGPPGTGKTFKLNQLKENNFTDKGVSQTSEEALRERVSGFHFWRVLGAVLATAKTPLSVSQIVEHPIVKARINPANKTNPKNLAWGELQSYANDESTQLIEKYRRSIQLFQKDQDSKWSIAEDKKSEIVNILDPDLLELAKNPTVQPKADGKSKTRYNFITFHQKYSYEDFIEGIKPVLKNDEPEDLPGDLQFELKKGIFYNSCIEALNLAGYQTFEDCEKDTSDNRAAKFEQASENPKLCFALFIDEINRANISAVFGELITLLESDKRIGAKHEMWVTLPGSGKKFGIPSNLYLVGTMNTADRSIALVDIALRRRFEFQGLYPDNEKGVGEWWGPILLNLNQAIYAQKKNPDFFIGHAFFIDKEESEKTSIFNHKIIPLLMEYFQNNLEKVQTILKAAEIVTEDLSIQNNFQLIAK